MNGVPLRVILDVSIIKEMLVLARAAARSACESRKIVIVACSVAVVAVAAEYDAVVIGVDVVETLVDNDVVEVIVTVTVPLVLLSLAGQEHPAAKLSVQLTQEMNAVMFDDTQGPVEIARSKTTDAFTARPKNDPCSTDETFGSSRRSILFIYLKKQFFI